MSSIIYHANMVAAYVFLIADNYEGAITFALFAIALKPCGDKE